MTSAIKHLSVWLTISLSLCAIWAPAQASDLTTQVNELVAKFPAPSNQVRNDTAAALLALGHDGVVKVTDLIKPDRDRGKDVKARFAVNALAFYAGRPAGQAHRSLLANCFLQAAKKTPDTSVKAFFIRQLRFVVTDQGLDQLALYLNDKQLADPATQCLIEIGNDKAAAAVLAALDKAPDTVHATLIRALGEMQVADAAGKLRKFAAHADREMRLTALTALAQIGDTDALAPIRQASQSQDRYESAKAKSLTLLCARRAAENGKKRAALKVCNDIIKKHKQDPAYRSAALTLLVDLRPDKKTLATLLDAMDSGNAHYQAAALELAGKFTGAKATKRWAKKLKSVDAPAKVLIIRMLGQRGDKTAAPALKAALAADDLALRLAATDALASLTGRDALQPLLQRLAAKPQPAEIDTVKRTLLWLPGDDVSEQIAKALPDLTPEARVAMLQVISSRPGGALSKAVLAQASADETAVQVAAFKAMRFVGSPQDLPGMIDVYAKTGSQSARAAMASITAILKQMPAEKRLTQFVVVNDRLDRFKAAQKVRLVALLPLIAGPDALVAAGGLLKSSQATVADAAVRALADWPEPLAAPLLLDIISTSDKLTHQVVATRGLVRLMDASSDPADAKLAFYTKAVKAVSRPEEKRLILTGVSKMKDKNALQLAAGLMAQADVQADAAAAVAKIALPAGKNPGLAGYDVAMTLTKALRHLKDDKLAKAVEAYLEKIPLPVEQGFTALFNGKDLTGWIGDTKGYAAEDGMIVCKPGGNLYTASEYGDFVFRFAFKLPPNGNNGLGIRTPPSGNPAYGGMELQILDNSGDKYTKLRPYQYHGSIYGVVPAERGFQRPVGQWNFQEVIAKGNDIKIILNGHTILDANLKEATTNGTMDGAGHPGLFNEKGHIGFLGHGHVVRFKDISIKPLD